MLKKTAASISYEDGIKKIIPEGLRKFEGLHELCFAPGTAKAIIYPTDDVCLNKEQFAAAAGILKPDEDLIVMQSGWSNDFFAEGNTAYSFCKPLRYEEYVGAEFYSPSIVFSSLFEWIIIIDESLNGGDALIVGKKERVSQFLAEYGHGDRDVLRFVDFYLTDSAERAYDPIYLRRMIRLLSADCARE